HYEVRLAENPKELEAVLTPLTEAGVDAFHASGRRYWQPEFPDTGSDLNIAGWAKKVTGKPVITVGSKTLSRPTEPTVMTGLPVTFFAHPAMFRSDPVSGNSGCQ
ncbi:hypothetical protein XU19_23730, partial [Vibrio parahaemolyticus]